MIEENFDQPLSLITERTAKQDTVMESAIALVLKLAITIRYLPTGSKFTDLQLQFGVHKSAISKFIPEVCEALCETLKVKYLKVGKHVPLMN